MRGAFAAGPVRVVAALGLAAVGACRDGAAPGGVAPPASAGTLRQHAKRAPAKHRPARDAAATNEPAGATAWSSPEACEAVLARGAPARSAGTARIGSWNLRWFPDGGPGKHAKPGRETDLAWLSCTITLLGVDVLAVQEIKRYPAARERAASLVAELDRRTGGAWKLETDSCPEEPVQHVGFLWNTLRATASSLRDVAALNPHGGACDKGLRPGFAGVFRFRGGLDLHLVSVHLKSGGERRSHDLRQKSYAALSEVWRDAQAALADGDLAVLGDFNTMGCKKCSPDIEPSGELASLDQVLAALKPALRRVGSDQPCSEYYAGHGGLLDHVVVTTATKELAADRAVDVAGYCSEAACGRLKQRDMPLAYQHLSDHCPVVLDFADRDED